MSKQDSQKCSNGHPADNEGLCRHKGRYYSKAEWLKRQGGS